MVQSYTCLINEDPVWRVQSSMLFGVEFHMFCVEILVFLIITYIDRKECNGQINLRSRINNN